MRASYRDLLGNLAVGVFLSAVAVSVVVAAANAPRHTQQRELAQVRYLERMQLATITVVETEKQAFVYIAEDDILDGPMPLSQALYTQKQYQDADAEVFTEGTPAYRSALRDMERRRKTGLPLTVLHAAAQESRD